MYSVMEAAIGFSEAGSQMRSVTKGARLAYAVLAFVRESMQQPNATTG
jgi:hypothetical protein